jgi:hypothetical protein
MGLSWNWAGLGCISEKVDGEGALDHDRNCAASKWRDGVFRRQER